LNRATTRRPASKFLTRNTGGAFVQVGALWEKAALETGECYLQGASMIRR
jgi:hypothetical protein